MRGGALLGVYMVNTYFLFDYVNDLVMIASKLCKCYCIKVSLLSIVEVSGNTHTGTPSAALKVTQSG